MYGSTVRELASRGHEVLLAYDSPDKRRDPAARRIESLAGVRIVPPLRPEGRRLVDALRQTADYLRFVDARFAAAPYLRTRMEKHLPARLAWARRLPTGSRTAAAARTLLAAVERLIRPRHDALAAIEAHRPDVVVISPLIARGPSGARQTDVLKAARKLAIPTAVGVSSWDHLTTKGVIKDVPDRLLVWNAVQVDEAVRLHGIAGDRIVATGAQLFDGWFERAPSTSRAEFTASLGLDPSEQLVLYVGSSPNITEPGREEGFVRGWLRALRASGPPLDRLGVAIRPHPGNNDHWASVDLSELGAAVAPRRRPEIPMSETDEALYFDSIHHAAAVVGINTSAIIESLVQRRPVLTIRATEFAETQEGTIHFHYLVPEGGGCVRAAADIPAHLGQLREVLADPEAEREAIERFLLAFVRPHGLDRPATPILADAIEELARRR
jgi:hypothetical protein